MNAVKQMKGFQRTLYVSDFNKSFFVVVFFKSSSSFVASGYQSCEKLSVFNRELNQQKRTEGCIFFYN